MMTGRILLTLLASALPPWAMANDTTADLTLQRQAPDNSDNRYRVAGTEGCSTLYAKDATAILEVHCANDNDGLHLFGKEYQGRHDWYDNDFAAWATTEGCNSAEDCHYQVKLDNDGLIREFRYTFFINQSEGFYRVKVGAGELEVLEKEITDYP